MTTGDPVPPADTWRIQPTARPEPKSPTEAVDRSVVIIVVVVVVVGI